MMRFPGQSGWKQTNRSDVLGSLWSTFNINLQDNIGRLRVSPRMKLATKTGDTDATNLGLPVAIKRFGGRTFAIAGARLFRNANGLPGEAFVEDTSTGTDTDYDPDYSDLENFQNVLVATAPTQIRTLSGSTGGTWTDRGSISASLLHKLCYFKKFDRLYFTNGGVRSMDSGFTIVSTGDYTLTTDSRFVYTDMKSTTNWIWLAGKQGTSDSARLGGVWQWDGISAQITKEYLIAGTRAVVGLVIDHANDRPYAMGDNGILYRFEGSGFKEVGRLPYTTHLPYNIDVSTTARFMHPNGIYMTKDGRIRCLINNLNGDNSATINENFPSGIWEWSEDNGFVHIQSLSYDPISSSITDYGQNRLSRVGALTDMNAYSTTSGRDGTMLAGATYYTDASTTTNGIFYDNSLDTIQKTGYFVTNKIFSQNVEEAWQEFVHRNKRLLDSGDTIVTKFRTTEADPTEFSITWASATSFTISGSTLDGREGDEIEVLQGKGAGQCAHIVSVTNNAGTRTVVLDQTFTGATSGTAKARVQAWKKLGSLTNQNLDWQSHGIGKISTWIQFKVFMRFKGKDEFVDAIINNTKHR